MCDFLNVSPVAYPWMLLFLCNETNKELTEIIPDPQSVKLQTWGIDKNSGVADILICAYSIFFIITLPTPPSYTLFRLLLYKIFFCYLINCIRIVASLNQEFLIITKKSG